MIHIVLPYPPTVNTYWHRSKAGHIFLSKKGRDYIELSLKALIDQKIKLPQPPLDEGEFYEVSMCAYPPDKRVRDLDNIKKALYDVLTKHGVIEDDKYVKHDNSYMSLSPIKPGAVVLVIKRSKRLLIPKELTIKEDQV